MLPKINTEIERPHNDVSLNNDRSHDRSHDKKSMATSLFSRNKMGTKTNEPIDYDGIKPTEQINAVKIPCVNEGYEKCNVEKWLENQFTMLTGAPVESGVILLSMCFDSVPMCISSKEGSLSASGNTLACFCKLLRRESVLIVCLNLCISVFAISLLIVLLRGRALS
jgi:hypothetical protein